MATTKRVLPKAQQMELLARESNEEFESDVENGHTPSNGNDVDSNGDTTDTAELDAADATWSPVSGTFTEEFDDTLDFEEPTGNEPQQQAGFGVEDDFEIDSDEIDDAKKLLCLPRGEYRKVPRNGEVKWVAKKRVRENDQEPKDRSSEGRTTYDFYGKIKQVKGATEGMFGFSVSYDKRHARIYQDGEDTGRRDPNKWDSAYKAWLQACDLFESKFKRKPSKASEVIYYLENGDYIIDVNAYRGKNMLNGFKI